MSETSDGAAALEAGFGALFEGLALLASLALLAMVAIICADVLTRNVAIPGLPRGVAWSNEISELLLYGMTLLAAPWLLREGRHIRVDIVLRVLPKRAAYACEWVADTIGLFACVWIVVYGSSADFARCAAPLSENGNDEVMKQECVQWHSLFRIDARCCSAASDDQSVFQS